ncbi:MAG TPA: M12 family metallopeptidase [Myxococcota bacterium]|nr:M12 family metallopeptidase [Myxococcota bacterium]
MRTIVLFLAACTAHDPVLLPDAVQGSDALDPAALEPTDVPAEGEEGVAWLVTDGGLTPVTYIVIDGFAVVEGDIVLGTPEEVERRNIERTLAKVGVESRSARWPNRVVPYVIDGALPDPGRVTAAIAHWEANTPFDFVPRTNQTDYIRFRETTSGSWDCSSSVGRQGGMQDINLNSGANPDEIVGIAIAKSNDHVYVWSDDGTVTSGTSSDLDDYRNGYAYSLPSGYAYGDIKAIGIRPGDDVVTWYTNGRYSIGHSNDLDAVAGPAPYTLPPGKTTANLLGADVLPDGRVASWYDDGTYALGTLSDLDASGSGYAWYAASGKVRSEVVGIGVASTGLAYLWYDDTDGDASRDWIVSRGQRGAVAADQDTYDYAPRSTCATGSLIHEIGHAVGLFHEQSRSDRDSFITINWGNIESGRSGNFDKQGGSTARDVSTYDYSSIMHYGQFAFADDPNVPTITTSNPAFQTVIGQRNGLSMGDLQSITELYGYSPAMRSSTSAYLPADIKGIGIAGSNDYVYTWHGDGYVTIGASYDLDDRGGRQTYSLAPGRTPSQLVAVAIAKSNDRCYAWYSNGTVSSGTSRDLDAYRAPYSYTLPPGYTIGNIVAMAITTNDRVVTFYSNGRYSVGSTSDLDAYTAPTSYSVTPGRLPSDIIDIDVAGATGRYYVWYDDYNLTVGNVSDLDAYQAAW